MSDLSELPAELRSHRQLEQASCAVSAFECVSKLHGLIETDTFPLQSDPKNQMLGFGDTEFLKFLGLSPLDGHYDTQSAVALIEKETNEGRFPLISLIGQTPKGEWYYHIHLCVFHNAKLLLIDPATLDIVADKKEDLAKVLERNSQQNPERKTLHILTYYL
jgi:hypothetical protein